MWFFLEFLNNTVDRNSDNSFWLNDLVQTNDFGCDIKVPIDLCKRFCNNQLVGYININSLKEKVIPLIEVLLIAPTDIFCLDETKLSSIVPDHQLKNEGYFLPFRKDRNSNYRWKLVCVREGFITKKIPNLEPEKVETTYLLNHYC